MRACLSIIASIRHGMSFVRYNLADELGPERNSVKDNLMFTADKVGEPMRVAALCADQEEMVFRRYARSVAVGPCESVLPDGSG